MTIFQYTVSNNNYDDSKSCGNITSLNKTDFILKKQFNKLYFDDSISIDESYEIDTIKLIKKCPTGYNDVEIYSNNMLVSRTKTYGQTTHIYDCHENILYILNIQSGKILNMNQYDDIITYIDTHRLYVFINDHTTYMTINENDIHIVDSGRTDPILTISLAGMKIFSDHYHHDDCNKNFKLTLIFTFLCVILCCIIRTIYILEKFIWFCIRPCNVVKNKKY